jgi:hypothetical protein
MAGSIRYLHKMDHTENLLKDNFTDRPRVAGRWDGLVGIATTYKLDMRGIGVRVPVGSRVFSSPHPPDLLSNGYQRLFPWGGKAAGA